MSLSRPTNTNINPAIKFFQWCGSDGRIKYYDKEKSENVFLDLPFKFIILDKLATVTGYSDNDGSGYWSNEVRSITSEEFIVKTKLGVKKEGLWSDINEGLKAQGAKFASSIYIAYFNMDTKQLELCNIKFYGSSITQWIDFLKLNKNVQGVSLVSAEKTKKGSNIYYIPVFQPLDIKDKHMEEAKKLDQELQEYLDKYFDYGNKYATASAGVSADAEFNDDTYNSKSTGAVAAISTEDDDIPF